MLFDPTELAGLPLQNRIVMAPMTRSRAVEGHAPNALVTQYYAERASAGLIVTEGTSPSPNGLGYARIPGIFSDRQVQAWRAVTDAVHAKGARIFLQLMHTGRVGHPLNLPAGAEVVGPMAEACPGEMFTDQQGPLPHTTPRAMTAQDIEKAVGEFASAARNAVKAGFDGVELHGANGYLIEQFLNANVNKRTDGYGGSAAGRNRFALEVARAAAAAIGKEKVGIRLSPYGAFNGTGAFDGVDAQHEALARELGAIGLAYVHLVDHSSMGAPKVPDEMRAAIRRAFPGTLILSGGYDKERAEADLGAGKGDLIAFGRPFLANPDLPERLRRGASLNAPDMGTFYTPGAKGYTDYPALS
jgi:N-ethylmaleimide reductase